MTSPDQILQAVANYYGLEVAEITGRKKFDHIMRARHMSMRLMWEHKMKKVAIARVLNRDHSTIVQNLQVSADLLVIDEAFKEDHKRLTQGATTGASLAQLIVEEAAKHFGHNVEDIKAEGVGDAVMRARLAAIYCLSNCLKFTPVMIALAIDRPRSTTHARIAKADDLHIMDAGFRRSVADIWAAAQQRYSQ